MGDKSKKDKEKNRKQKVVKEEQSAKIAEKNLSANSRYRKPSPDFSQRG